MHNSQIIDLDADDDQDYEGNVFDMANERSQINPIRI